MVIFKLFAYLFGYLYLKKNIYINGN
jgi:hypothetical protein